MQMKTFKNDAAQFLAFKSAYVIYFTCIYGVVIIFVSFTAVPGPCCPMWHTGWAVDRSRDGFVILLL